MEYNDAYKYADAVFSKRFELLPTQYPWNASEIAMVNNTQVWGLVSPFTDYARKLMISKIFAKPLEEIRAI